MYASDARQLRFKMPNGLPRWVVPIEKTERALQEMEQLRCRVFWFGRDLDEFDEVRSGLGPEIIFTDSDIGILQNDFSESVKIGTAASADLNLGLEKKIELSREGAFCSAGSLRRGIDFA